MKIVGDITKFSFPELTSSDNGKTSSTATSGFITIMVGLICFFICICMKNTVLAYASFSVITVGAGLLGWNKKVNSDNNKIDSPDLPIVPPDIH